MKTIAEFAGQKNGYSRSITLRNTLIPQGKTEENIAQFLVNDKERADAYPQVKRVIDELHKSIIEDVLKSVTMDWQPLANALIEYQKGKNDKTKKNLEMIQTKQMKAITMLFSTDERFAKVFKAELFKELLPAMIQTNSDIKDKADMISRFNNFSTYFTGFHENRKNIYNWESGVTSVSYRLVHDNFPKFMANKKFYDELKANHNQILLNTEKSLSDFLGGKKLDDIFSVQGFNDVLTQSGIDFYNTVIGGISEKYGKLQGLNEHINLYRQNSDTREQGKKLHGKMIMLFKQILSDRESASFKIEKFESDTEVYEELLKFNGRVKNILIKIEELLAGEYDLSKIFVPEKSLTDFSLIMTERWNVLEDAIRFDYIQKNGEPKNKTQEEKFSKCAKNDFSMSQLSEYFENYKLQITDEEKEIYPVFKNFFDLNCLKESVFKNIENEKYENLILGNAFNTLFSKIKVTEKTNLRLNKEDAIPIKDYLDAVQNLYHYFKLIDYRGDEEKDTEFYFKLDEIMESLSEIVPLYNKVRNYVTKKATSEEKFKLNFDCPTLADGWDENKEQQNNAIILRKDGKYYLGIFNPKDKPKFDIEFEIDGKEYYEKMVYKLLPGPNKMLPKVFFSNKGLETFNPPQSILDGYNAGKYKKGDAFDINFCHKLIDWFKNAINQHEDWKKFNFKFSDTKSYEDISAFYREVTEQGYKISFTKIPIDFIDKSVEDGKLLLFQIYNKDFAEKSTGKKNLHTLYWENLFSEENLSDTVLKLNGEAELFFRPASLKTEETTKHKVGSILVNRTTKEGKPIPEEIYQEFYKKLNGKLDGELSDKAKEFEANNTIISKSAKHEIVKDKHYTKNTYLFHCPITMNFKAAEIAGGKFNDKVLDYLKDNPDVKIIGIDRGERHLLYLSMINQKGEIEIQQTLNIVEQSRGDKNVKVDYQQKLHNKETERDNARKNWQTIGNIKELKAGYLSVVVHDIAKMMVENNAILVMEDLNFGFKRGRFAVERQVYQKFEQMLIDKLNYLVFKDKATTEPGGVLNAYQLTNKFESFQKLGKQCGWIFYVPAAYTSKIDPRTGFADLFKKQGITNVQKKKEFFHDFESIRYDKETDSFAFKFKYSDENSDFKKEWEVFTRGERIKYNPKERKTFTVLPTEDLKKGFDMSGIEWANGNNLIEEINNLPAESHNKKSVDFFDCLYRSFTTTLQMRNSIPNTEEDYLISPVKSTDGTFFDSREQAKLGVNAKLPIDADANGAYHIALKGLLLLKNDFNKTEKGYIGNIPNSQWFEFVQSKAYSQ